MNRATRFRNSIPRQDGGGIEIRCDVAHRPAILLIPSSSRFGTNQRSFTHEIRVSGYARGLLFGRIASREQRKTIDQAPTAPVNEFLSEAMQAVLCA